MKIIDLTGVGDLFAAGYLPGMISKMSIKESLIKGSELSLKIIQKIVARMLFQSVKKNNIFRHA